MWIISNHAHRRKHFLMYNINFSIVPKAVQGYSSITKSLCDYQLNKKRFVAICRIKSISDIKDSAGISRPSYTDTISKFLRLYNFD